MSTLTTNYSISKPAAGATGWATELNNDLDIIDAKIKAPGGSRVEVKRTANQTLSNTTFHKIEFNSESIDSKNEFDPTTNFRFTASEAGDYLVAGELRFASNATGIRQIILYKNGSGYVNWIAAAGSNVLNVGFAYVMSLSASDYIEIYAWQDSGGNLDVVANEIQLSIRRIHN